LLGINNIYTQLHGCQQGVRGREKRVEKENEEIDFSSYLNV
jgi:hypothetical protein